MRFYRVKMSSGEVHVGRDPGRRGYSWISKMDDELLNWMGKEGHSCVEEIPLEYDLTEGVCQRCGGHGVERHHTSPRDIFDDPDEWPLIDLCPTHHRAWHRRMNEWAKQSNARGKT